LSASAIASPAFDAALPFVLRWEGGYVGYVAKIPDLGLDPTYDF